MKTETYEKIVAMHNELAKKDPKLCRRSYRFRIVLNPLRWSLVRCHRWPPHWTESIMWCIWIGPFDLRVYFPRNRPGIPDKIHDPVDVRSTRKPL